jgi:hypothetical protein
MMFEQWTRSPAGLVTNVFAQTGMRPYAESLKIPRA